TWTGGDQTNTGSTIVEAGATLTVSGSADKTLAGRTLVNHGTATWSGSGALRGSFSTTRLINSGVFDVQTDALLGSQFFAELTVENQAGGVFKKTAGPGQTTIGGTFNNSGTLILTGHDPAVGRMSIGGPFTQTATGTLAVSLGGSGRCTV